jgi:competence ComEA-like helix-hairpin-helix protein
MKKNRPKDRNSFSSAGQKGENSSSDNVLVFLLLAAILLIISVSAGYSHYFVPKILSVRDNKRETYVWISGSSEITQGLYLYETEKLKNQIPAISSLLPAKSAHETNPSATAVRLDAAEHRIIALPPEVANIFFQPIPINRADENIISSLPGIGPVLAARIAQWRSRHGPFRSKEALRQIAGIGPKKFAEIVQHITLE